MSSGSLGAAPAHHAVGPSSGVSGSGAAAALWEPLAFNQGSPPPRCSAAAAVARSKMYLFGGKTGSTATGKSFNDLYAFNPTLFTWERLLPADGVVPQQRSACTLLPYGEDQLILFAGCDGNVALNDLWVYKIEENRWVKMKTQGGAGGERPKPVYHHSAVIFKDVMFVYGGWMSEWGRGDKLWKLDLNTWKWDGIAFAKGAVVPERRFGHVATVHDGAMYVFGGAKSVGPTNEMWRYLFDSGRWTNLSAAAPTGGDKTQSTPGMPSARKFMASVQFDENWLIHGGCLNDDTSLADAWEYSFSRNEWSAAVPFATERPRDSHSCVVVERPFSDGVIMTAGRVNKTAETNETLILGVFKTHALQGFDEDMEALKSAQGKLSLPEATLDELAVLLRPVAEHRLEHAEQLRASLAEVTDPVLKSTDSKDEPGKSEVVAECVTSLGETMIAIANGTANINEKNDDECKADPVVCWTAHLKKFVANVGELEGEAAEAEVTVTSGPRGETLCPAAQDVLKDVVNPLVSIEEQMKKVWNVFLHPGLSTLEQDGADKAAVLLAVQREEMERLEKELRDVSLLLTDMTLPIRERRHFSQRRMGAALDFLNFFDSKLDALVTQLDEPPISLDVNTANFKHETSEFIESFKVKEQEYSAKIEELHETLEKMRGFQTDASKGQEKEEKNFEVKRQDYGAKRSKLLGDLQEYVSKVMGEYEKVLEDEKRALLAVEKKRREDNETRRQIADLQALIDVPLQRCTRFRKAYEAGTTLVENLHESSGVLLDKLQRHTNKSAAQVASEIVVSKWRFPALAAAVGESLKKSLNSQENALKKIEERMKAKLAKLELLEGAGDPDELASEDGSEVSMPVARAHGPAQQSTGGFDPFIVDALGEGGGGSIDVNSQRPYQTTLNKYHQYKQLFERLQSEVEILKSQIESVENIQQRYGAKLDTLKSRPASDVPSESLLGLLLESGFDWDTFETEKLAAAAASAGEEGREEEETDENRDATAKSNTTWLADFYNVDPANYRPKSRHHSIHHPNDSRGGGVNSSSPPIGSVSAKQPRGGAHKAKPKGAAGAATGTPARPRVVPVSPQASPSRFASGTNSTRFSSAKTHRGPQPTTPPVPTTPPPIGTRSAFLQSTAITPPPSGQRKHSTSSHVNPRVSTPAGSSSPPSFASATGRPPRRSARNSPNDDSGANNLSVSLRSLHHAGSGAGNFARQTSSSGKKSLHETHAGSTPWRATRTAAH